MVHAIKDGCKSKKSMHKMANSLRIKRFSPEILARDREHFRMRSNTIAGIRGATEKVCGNRLQRTYVRWGIIGCGGIAREWSPALFECKASSVVAVMD